MKTSNVKLSPFAHIQISTSVRKHHIFKYFYTMDMKRFLSLFVFCLFATTIATAYCKKKKKHHFKLVTAYSKNIPQNEQSNPPMEGHFFVVKWKSNSTPQTFFWRGEGGWLTCKIESATESEKDGSGTYTGNNISIANISKGDLLLLTPLTGGRFPIPDEIPESARNTLFYKVGNSNWLAYPVNNIDKK